MQDPISEANKPPHKYLIPLISFALSIMGLLTYVTDGVLFLTTLLLMVEGDFAVIWTPRLILIGFIFNLTGIVTSLLGLCFARGRRLLCLLPLGLNAIPPLIVLAILAVGLILIG